MSQQQQEGEDLALVVDRFVSASSADDAREGLRSIRQSLQQQSSNNDDDDDDNDVQQVIFHSEPSVLQAFLQVLATGEYNGFPVEDTIPLVCQIYTLLLTTTSSALNTKQAQQCLMQPEEGRLLSLLLDVVCLTEGTTMHSNYTRVSALQLITLVCRTFPSLAQSQLLAVPNGLHRLADLLQLDETDTVRNEALVLALTVAQWPSCAKLWVFCELCDAVIAWAVQEGGLRGGSVIVQDCLQLLLHLLKHDVSLCDLVWQSLQFAPKLCALLDLREGLNFVEPKQSDDLDDLLEQDDQQQQQINKVVPKLLLEEELVLEKVMELLSLMMGTPDLRQRVWKQHTPLCALMWELALWSPPPPRAQYVCAVPSTKIQQAALECVAQCFASPDIMEKHHGLDRLLFLVCTGTQPGLSQAALHVIRQTLNLEESQQIVWHTLAPPIEGTQQEEPTVIEKLLNTCFEKLEQQTTVKGRTINLLGAMGGLSLFLRDTTTREAMLKITGLVDPILKQMTTEQDPDVLLALERFLCEWTFETPSVVRAILSSNESTTALGTMFRKKSVLSSLLLGLCMEFMESNTAKNEEEKEEGGDKANKNDDDNDEFGGWSRTSLLQMIQGGEGGVSGYLKRLDSFDGRSTTWSACPLELAHFTTWYQQQVRVVRKRIVSELTGSKAGDQKEQQPHDVALQKMVADQSNQIEKLQERLDEAQTTIRSQSLQLETWKQRVESNPTQLDTMLNDLSQQTGDLKSEIERLKEKHDTSSQKHEEETQKLEATIRELQTQLAESNSAQESANNECVALRDELAALSSAYSQLEEEYHQSSSAAAAAAEQTQGEGSSQEHQQYPNNESEVLRAENARLRKDAQAADEWMRMAVQKMNDIGNENTALKSKTEELEQELATAKSVSLTERQRQVPTEEHSVQTDEAIQQQQLSGANDDLVEELRADLLIAKAEVTALNEERRQLEMKLAESSGSGQGEGELLALQTQKQQEMDSLRESLQQERTEMELSLRDEIEQRDQTIRSLETRLEQQNDQSEFENKLADLQAANNAAQEWMAQAVDHHKLLSDELASQKRENEELQLRLSQGDNTAVGESQAAVVASLEQEINGLQASLRTRDEELLELQAKARKETTEYPIDDRSELVNSLRTELEETRNKGKEVEQELMKLYQDNAEINQQITVLRDELDGRNKDLLARADEMEQLRQTTQQEIGRLKEETERQQQTGELTHGEASAEELVRLQAELQSTQEELQKLQLAHHQASMEAVASNDQIVSLRERLDETNNTTDTVVVQLRSELSAAIKERDEGIVEQQQLRERLTEFQEWCTAAQERMGELVAEKQQAGDELDKMRETVEAETAKLQQDLAAATALGQDASIIREENVKLSVRVQEADDLCDQLTHQNKSLEDELQQLQTQLADKTNDEAVAEEFRVQLEEKENALLQAQQETMAVREEMQQSYDENMQLVTQWQERCLELEKDINQLKQELGEEQVKSSKSLSEWQEEKQEWETEKSRLEEALEDAEFVRDSNVEATQTLQQRIQEMEEEIESNNVTAEDQSKEAQDKITELESVVSQLEAQLEETQTEATTTVEQWQNHAATLEEEKQGLQESLEASEAETTKLQEELATLGQDASIVQEENVKLSVRVQEADDLYEQLTQQNKSLEDELQQLQTQLADKTNDEAAAEEFRTQLEEKENALLQAQQEAMAVREEMQQSQNEISQWEERCLGLEKDINQLKQDLGEEQVKSSKSLSEWQEEKQEWETEKSRLEEALEDAEFVRDSNVEATQTLQQRIQEMEEEMKSNNATAEDQSKEAQDKITELESVVSQLEAQLEETQTEATAAIDQWQSHATTLEEEKEDIQGTLDSLRDELEQAKELLKDKEAEFDAALAEETKARKAAEEAAGNFDDQINDIAKESEDVVSQWQARVKELENAVADLETQLDQQQEEASAAIAQWEESYTEMENQYEEVSKESQEHIGLFHQLLADRLASLGSIHHSLSHEHMPSLKVDTPSMESLESVVLPFLKNREERLSAAVEKVLEDYRRAQDESMSLHESLESRKAAFNALNQEVKNLEDATAEKQMETDRVNNDLIDANSRLRKFEQEIAFEKNERRMLEAHILNLEDELRECHESLQVYVTNEISKRATEMVTESLREEVAELRCKIVEDREALQVEQKARKSAQKEVDRLQADLALVLRVEMRDGNMDEQIKSMVMKTANNVQQKERAEIDELRQSLERTLRELEQAKATERDASERAASAELQVSACEQEIVATKAKVETLTHNLEEAREAEEARVASFEYRVSALEDDRDVLRRVHADELETMRNELSLIAMEKDRILQSLRESEKTNAALVFEASNKQDDSSLPIQAREVAKLRAANSQLLAAATQEAARTERRIREAVAASGSSSEADIIVERELRTAAEMALEIAKEELQEARKRAEGIKPKSPLTKNITEEKLATQLKHSRAESTKLKDEIDSLKAELDKERQESQNTIDALTEECRQAQSTALKLERESHYEAEISTEMIKVKSPANYEETPEQEEQQNWVVVNEDPADERVDSAEAYDYILEQKMAIQEEREIYRELLAEHDDLLALLAQLDVEKACLHEALAKIGGEGAVEAATVEAEKKATEQFGKFIRLAL